jgi:hypothetical protein
MIVLNEDYKEMLQILLGNEVKFLIIGAYAMGVYGYPRATGDFDIWVENSIENSKKIYKSLSQFGAPVTSINENTFTEKGIIFQVGVAPRRIDVITCIDGVTFQDAYESKENIAIDNLILPFISKANLIKNKRSTGRQKDKLDASDLENN